MIWHAKHEHTSETIQSIRLRINYLPKWLFNIVEDFLERRWYDKTWKGHLKAKWQVTVGFKGRVSQTVWHAASLLDNELKGRLHDRANKEQDMKIIRRNKSSYESMNMPLRVTLVSLEGERERNMSATLSVIMADMSHPPHGSLSAKGSSFHCSQHH